MTKWGVLLLGTYIALGVTRRLTQRQAGGIALAVTLVVVGVAFISYRTSTPTDKYIKAVDATVYATGDPAQETGPPTTEDQAGVKAATWLTTNHTPGVLAGNTGGGG